MAALLQEVSPPKFVATLDSRREVLERYEGRAVDVSVAIVRDKANPRRERLEFVCAPDVRLEQNVEESAVPRVALYRQVHLTFETGRDRALCLHMIYGVIAGLFMELDRSGGDKRGTSSARGSTTSSRRAIAPRATSGAPRSAARSCATWPG